MKRQHSFIWLFVLILLLTPFSTHAADGDSDQLLQWNSVAGSKVVELTFRPSNDMIQSAVTTLQMTFEVTDPTGTLTELTVSLPDTVKTKYTVAEALYHADTKTLDIFLSSAKPLFDENTGAFSLATVDISSSVTSYQVGFKPTQIQMVNQSHVSQSVAESELTNLVSTVSGGLDEVMLTDLEALIQELELGSASTVIYKMEKGITISAENQKRIFTALKGKNKILRFVVYDNGVISHVLSFNGTQITDVDVVLDFGMTATKEEPTIGEILNTETKFVDVDFSHLGLLPGQVQIGVNVGDYFANTGAYLNYYNPDTKEIVPVDQEVQLMQGYAVFDTVQGFHYVLTSQKLSQAVSLSKENQTSGVATGDETLLSTPLIGMGCAILLMNGVLLRNGIRKRKEDEVVDGEIKEIETKENEES
jgi:hypothetical protein